MRGQNTLDTMLYLDTKSWLPDDLLIKADKITMANSLELRVPLLDHKVLEFAAALPMNLKVRGFTTKYLAKKALGSRIPKEILNRRKAGFPVPYESWLRKDLGAGYAKSCLTPRPPIEAILQPRSCGNCWPATRRKGDILRRYFRWSRSSFGRGPFWSNDSLS